MSSLIAGFPRELLDGIMDHVDADKHEFASYGLVCKARLPSSRYRVFTNLRLKSSNAYAFFDLLVSLLPPVTDYTRNIEIYERDDMVDPVIKPWINDFFLRLPEFPSLQSLSLVDFSLLFLTSETKAAFFATTCGVTELDIRGKDGFFNVPEDFIRMIGVFPRLELLILQATSGWGEDGFAFAERPVPSTLQRLFLRSCPKAEILTCLVRNGVSLHTMQLDAVDEEALAVVGGCCRALGSGLKSLELDLQRFELQDSGASIDRLDFNLNHNPELASLRFNVDLKCYEVADHGMPIMRWASRILSHLVLPHLEKIVFFVSLIYRSEAEFHDHDWVKIAQPLEQMQLPRLQAVVFYLSWGPMLSYEPEEIRQRRFTLMEEKVKESLSECARQEILKIYSA